LITLLIEKFVTFRLELEIRGRIATANERKEVGHEVKDLIRVGRVAARRISLRKEGQEGENLRVLKHTGLKVSRNNRAIGSGPNGEEVRK